MLNCLTLLKNASLKSKKVPCTRLCLIKISNDTYPRHRFSGKLFDGEAIFDGNDENNEYFECKAKLDDLLGKGDNK